MRKLGAARLEVRQHERAKFARRNHATRNAAKCAKDEEAVSEKSSGLELRIVQCVVDASGRQVRCESQPGAGATFVFKLPVTGRKSR